MDSAFPRLSPNGLHVASGAESIWIDDKLVANNGTTPVWLSNEEILFTGNGGLTDGFLFAYRIGDLKPRLLRGLKGHAPDSVATNGAGLYAFEEYRTIIVSNGRVVTNAFRPTFAGNDLCWGVDDGSSVTLYREGRIVAKPVHQHRGLADGRLVFTRYSGGLTPKLEINIELPDRTIQSWALRGAYEFNPCSVFAGGEPWVFSNTADERLLLRTGNNGVVLTKGLTYDPDIAALDANRVRVVYQTGARTLESFIRDVTSLEQQDLRVPEFAPWPPGTGWSERAESYKIDLSRFLFGTPEGNLTPRVGAPIGVTLDGNRLYTHRMKTDFLASGAIHQYKEFGEGIFGQVWTYSPKLQAYGLSWDQTDGKRDKGGYCVVNQGTRDTAPLFPKFATVGEIRNVPIDILHVGSGDRESHIWRGGVKSVWNGPGGLWACIIWDFDHVGFIEENWCLLDVGLKMWVEINETTKTQRRAFFWNPAKEFTPQEIPVPKFTDAIPKAVVIPEETVPKVEVLTREQFIPAIAAVNDFYKSEEGLQRPGGMVIDGEVDITALQHWIYALVVKERSVQQCLAEIRQSEEWKAKHAGDPQPDPQ